MRSETFSFPNGSIARLVRVAPGTAPAGIMAALGLPQAREVICVNGGTAELEEPLKSQLALLLGEGIARVATEDAIPLVTGGTDAGIFALLGDGFARFGKAATCVGVVPASCVSWPGHPDGETALEPHHSHFVAVEGREWGDETETLVALTGALGERSVAIIAGGGDVTLREMHAHAANDRRMILLAGSGRATDTVLAARSENSSQPETQKLVDCDLIEAFPVNENPAALRTRLRELLRPAGL